MRLFLLFCLISISVFSQREKQTIFIQGDCGITTYINPSTKVLGTSPSAEIILTSNLSKKDSSKVTACFLAGIGFVRTTQVYDVLDYNTVNTVKNNFYTNEFLLTLGGMAKFNLSKKIYLNIGGGGQIGANYTWSPAELASIYKIVPISPSQGVTPQNGYKTVTELTPYKWEYYQFYLFGKIQFGVNISKRISVFAGFTARIFICKNDISNEADMLQFNYAPVKLTSHIGLQARLFK